MQADARIDQRCASNAPQRGSLGDIRHQLDGEHMKVGQTAYQDT